MLVSCSADKAAVEAGFMNLAVPSALRKVGVGFQYLLLRFIKR